MLSLFLTLFISLFSICPAYNEVGLVKDNTFESVVKSRVYNAITNDTEELTALTLSDFGNNYIVKGFVYNCCDNVGRLESFSNGLIDLSISANGPIYNNFNNISGLYFYDLVNNTRVDITQVNTTIDNSTLYSNCRELRIWFGSSQYPAGWLRFDITFNSLAYYTFAEPYSYVNCELSTLGHTFSKQSAFFFDYYEVPTAFNNIFGYGGWNHEIIALQDNSYQLGYDNGYDAGELVGKAEGIEEGYESGYAAGFQAGEETQDAYDDGFNAGRQTGYAEGLADAEVDSTIFTIFSGILDVGLLPVNVFLAILNFEVFGINISGFVSALLTVSIAIIVIRFIFGGKKND